MEDQLETSPPNVPAVPETTDGRWVHVPDDDDDLLFGDDLGELTDFHGVWEIYVMEHAYDSPVADLLCQYLQIFEEVFVATGDRKKRIEVDYRRLGPGEQKLFDTAKRKEIMAWLDHGTAKRLAKGSLHPEQIMRCRWLLTWKDPLPGSN